MGWRSLETMRRSHLKKPFRGGNIYAVFSCCGRRRLRSVVRINNPSHTCTLTLGGIYLVSTKANFLESCAPPAPRFQPTRVHKTTSRSEQHRYPLHPRHACGIAQRPLHISSAPSTRVWFSDMIPFLNCSEVFPQKHTAESSPHALQT